MAVISLLGQSFTQIIRQKCQISKQKYSKESENIYKLKITDSNSQYPSSSHRSHDCAQWANQRVEGIICCFLAILISYWLEIN